MIYIYIYIVCVCVCVCVCVPEIRRLFPPRFSSLIFTSTPSTDLTSLRISSDFLPATACIYMYVCVYIHIYMHVCVYIYTLVHIDIYIYIYTHIYTHTHIYISQLYVYIIQIHRYIYICISSRSSKI